MVIDYGHEELFPTWYPELLEKLAKIEHRIAKLEDRFEFTCPYCGRKRERTGLIGERCPHCNNQRMADVLLPADLIEKLKEAMQKRPDDR